MALSEIQTTRRRLRAMQKSMRQIAKDTGISPNTIWRFLRGHDIVASNYLELRSYCGAARKNSAVTVKSATALELVNELRKRLR